MDFLKKRLSLNSDPEKESGGKASGILESLSNRRATLWNDFTSKMKSDRISADVSDAESDSGNKSVNSGKTFMDTVKEKLQRVKMYENGEAASDAGSTKLRGSEPECAPLIDTADNSSEDNSDIAIGSDTGSAPPPVQVKVTDESQMVPSTATRRKRLGKKQDSFTAEEVYMDTVAAQLKNGLLEPDTSTTLVSPSKAVQEFSFADGKSGEKLLKSKKCTLTVSNSNLINFDSIQNLSSAASSISETIVHHEDDGVFDYESSG